MVCDTKYSKEQQSNFKKIFVEEEIVGKELNTNVLINLGNMIDNDPKISHYFNNDGRLNYNGLLKKSSRYKFSKLKKFHQFEPIISFDGQNIIFFDNKGSILNLTKI